MLPPPRARKPPPPMLLLRLDSPPPPITKINHSYACPVAFPLRQGGCFASKSWHSPNKQSAKRSMQTHRSPGIVNTQVHHGRTIPLLGRLKPQLKCFAHVFFASSRLHNQTGISVLRFCVSFLCCAEEQIQSLWHFLGFDMGLCLSIIIFGRGHAYWRTNDTHEAEYEREEKIVPIGHFV